MALLTRLIRYSAHETWWIPFGFIVITALAIWQFPDRLSVTKLVGISGFGFLLPYFFRTAVIKRYSRVRHFLYQCCASAIVLLIIARFTGYFQLGAFVYVGCVAIFCGAVFWAASDPMFAMINWLCFPTEYGRPPDEIQLIDDRYRDWPGESGPIRCQLFRFRYGNDWNIGITGPLTFALGDQDLDGKSPDEVYSVYEKWFSNEDIAGLIREEMENEG